MAFCATCGNQMADSATFCTKCGAKHTANSQPAPHKGMKACRECGHEVSATAKACPNCGALNPALGKKTYGLLSLITLGIGVIVFIGLWRACESGGPSVSESDVASTAPAVSVSAAQLAADYQANEVAADEKYKQRIIEVSGAVDTIGKDITDTIYVTMQTGEEYAIVKPQLFFSDQHKDEAAALRKGESLTVKCRCDGKFMNVLLRDCVIETSPSASAVPNSALKVGASVTRGEQSSNPAIEKDLRLAKIGTNLQKLGVSAITRGQHSDDASVKQQALVEGAADEIVGCEVWSSMASTTTPDMDDACKHEHALVDNLPPETQAAIQRQMVIVRTGLGKGRYPQ